MIRIDVGRGSVRAGLAALSLAAMVCYGSAAATEPKSDLDVTLRLAGTTSAGTAERMTGTARIEVTVEALRATRGVRLEVVRADGTPWPLGGVRVLGGGDALDVPARGSARAWIEVPLAGEAVHEIVVRARGEAGEASVATESMILVPLGRPAGLPVDDGAYASFDLQEVRP